MSALTPNADTRLRLPGYLAFQMPKGRQLNTHQKSQVRARLGRAGLSLRSRSMRDRSIGWDGEIAANLSGAIELQILSRDLSVSEQGIETVFATVKSVSLIPPDAKFDVHRIVDDSYLKLSTIFSRLPTGSDLRQEQGLARQMSQRANMVLNF
jgi:hypothetical protein